jgi:hypothetical protein
VPRDGIASVPVEDSEIIAIKKALLSLAAALLSVRKIAVRAANNPNLLPSPDQRNEINEEIEETVAQISDFLKEIKAIRPKGDTNG